MNAHQNANQKPITSVPAYQGTVYTSTPVDLLDSSPSFSGGSGSEPVCWAEPPSVRENSGSVETKLTGPAAVALESEIQAGC